METVKYDLAIDALAVWEAMLDIPRSDWGEAGQIGTCAMREFCLEEITPLINKLFDLRDPELWAASCYDWDYVPAALWVLTDAFRNNDSADEITLAKRVDDTGRAQ